MSFRSAVALRSVVERKHKSVESPNLAVWIGRTHVLAAHFSATLLEALLDIFFLIALVVPETPDEVVERLFEPALVSAGRHEKGGH